MVTVLWVFLIPKNGLQWVAHDIDEELLLATQTLKSWQMM